MLRTSTFPTPTITTIFAVETSREMNHEAPEASGGAVRVAAERQRRKKTPKGD
jgi:hypothetical protein